MKNEDEIRNPQSAIRNAQSAALVRRPAVAGYFYPSNAIELASSIDRLIDRAVAPKPAKALILPHGSLGQCGRVLGTGFSQVSIPRKCILLGPSHTGSWMPWSLMLTGWYRTPLGDVPIDTPLAEALQARCPFLEADSWAQRGEHAIEVLLPFLQRLGPSDLSIVPVICASESAQQLGELAQALAQVVRLIEEPVLLIASADFSHYEPVDQVETKDAALLKAVEALSEASLLHYVASEGIRMCGAGVVAALILAAKQLNATQAKVLSYGTSAVHSGDRYSAIGYASVVID